MPHLHSSILMIFLQFTGNEFPDKQSGSRQLECFQLKYICSLVKMAKICIYEYTHTHIALLWSSKFSSSFPLFCFICCLKSYPFWIFGRKLLGNHESNMEHNSSYNENRNEHCVLFSSHVSYEIKISKKKKMIGKGNFMVNYFSNIIVGFEVVWIRMAPEIHMSEYLVLSQWDCLVRMRRCLLWETVSPGPGYAILKFTLFLLSSLCPLFSLKVWLFSYNPSTASTYCYHFFSWCSLLYPCETIVPSKLFLT